MIFTMNILITAGNTQTPIDKVRCLTNVFSGRTGAKIADAAAQRGHHVMLLTSVSEAIAEFEDIKNVEVRKYRTFENLEGLMHGLITLNSKFDAIVHAAAVNDYHVSATYAPAPGTSFDPRTTCWSGPGLMLDRAAGKIKSDEPELWLRLTRAPKLVDAIRTQWKFQGVLVKFKLEVGITDERLLEIAEASRVHSDADLMVANTLEGMNEWAYIGPFAAGYRKTPRPELADFVLDAVEKTRR